MLVKKYEASNTLPVMKNHGFFCSKFAPMSLTKLVKTSQTWSMYFCEIVDKYCQ